jgi:hypothetical protein
LGLIEDALFAFGVDLARTREKTFTTNQRTMESQPSTISPIVGPSSKGLLLDLCFCNNCAIKTLFKVFVKWFCFLFL